MTPPIKNHNYNYDKKQFVDKYVTETCIANPDLPKVTIMLQLEKVFDNLNKHKYKEHLGGMSQTSTPEEFKNIVLKVYNLICQDTFSVSLSNNIYNELYILYRPLYEASTYNDIINLLLEGNMKTIALLINDKQGVLEYLISELIELAKGCDVDNNHNHITFECIVNAINADKELYELFDNLGTLSNNIYHINY